MAHHQKPAPNFRVSEVGTAVCHTGISAVIGQSYQKVTKNSDAHGNSAHWADPQTSDLRVGGSNPSGRATENHRKPFEFPNCERRPALSASVVSDQQVTKNSDGHGNGESMIPNPGAVGSNPAGGTTENLREPFEFPNCERRPAIPSKSLTDQQLTKNSDSHENRDRKFICLPIVVAIVVGSSLAARPHRVFTTGPPVTTVPLPHKSFPVSARK